MFSRNSTFSLRSCVILSIALFAICAATAQAGTPGPSHPAPPVPTSFSSGHHLPASLRKALRDRRHSSGKRGEATAPAATNSKPGARRAFRSISPELIPSVACNYPHNAYGMVMYDTWNCYSSNQSRYASVDLWVQKVWWYGIVPEPQTNPLANVPAWHYQGWRWVYTFDHGRTYTCDWSYPATYHGPCVI
jgi:hypothetical protein